MELLESRIYTFVDSTKRFAFYFLEGQQLIRELALIHPLQGGGFAYFRDVVLSFMPMLALLKHGEQLGLYLDAEDPYLRVKLEITAGGHVRCLLMPEDLKEFPERITGIVLRCDKSTEQHQSNGYREHRGAQGRGCNGHLWVPRGQWGGIDNHKAGKDR